MLKSMTAFGRASIATPIGRFVAEIQSVNRKFLEISTYIPRELSRFDLEIKKWIGEAINRGQVNFKLNVAFDEVAPVSVRPNMPLVRQIAKAWQEIQQELGLKGEIDLNILAANEDVLIFDENIQEENRFREAIKEVVTAALKELVQMRIVEGKALAQDIRKRLEILSKALESIEEKAPDATTKYRQKILERLSEISPGIENEERLLREVAVFAEKVDITEEITRFRSHLSQFEELLKEPQDSVGKTLDFLVQELNRETNTIGSKSMDVTVSKQVVGIKSELERIREQIQNVE